MPKFLMIAVAGTLSGGVVQQEMATGIGMQTIMAVGLSGLLVAMLLRARG